MVTGDAKHGAGEGDLEQVMELRNIPQINLQSDNPDLSRFTSFQKDLGSNLGNHQSSNTRTRGDCTATNTALDSQTKKPRFVSRDGAIGGKSHNETNVDVVLIPCPGADPHETWMREPLARDFFRRLPTHHHSKMTKRNKQLAAPGMTSNTSLPHELSKDTKSWARSGVRNEVNTARVLTYDHGDLMEDRNLKTMADDLLSALRAEIAEKLPGRPFFFICHSIGGLVLKLALIQASRNVGYRPILEDCYGVTFFATPHRGSSYLSIDDFVMSIQQLLRLSRPMTPQLRRQLRPDDPFLLKIDDDFKQLSSEFQVWSFHGTEDSKLSRVETARSTDIPFRAPITSMRSAILGVRHEKVYVLQSSHENCASFGMKNAQTLRLYLSDLGIAIRKAESLNQNTTHVPLRLEQRVRIEVHGFYESSLANEASGDTSVRLFSTKDHSLEAFWEEGPDGLLEKRLHDIRSESQHDPQDTQFFGQKGRAHPLLSPTEAVTGGEEARQKTRRPSVTVVLSGTSSTAEEPRSAESPKRHSLIPEPTSYRTTHGQHHPPDAQSSPGLDPVRKGSLPKDIPASHEDKISSMSRSTTGSKTLVSQMAFSAASGTPQPIRRASSQRTVRQYLRPTSPTGRERRGSETAFIQDMKVGSAILKPSSKTRKFVWIHTPFNNPVWVRKVFDTISLKERQDYSELFSSEIWTARHERGRHTQLHACYLKPACGYVSLKTKTQSMPLGQTAAGARGVQRSHSSLPRQGCLYLYFPFLHFDSYKMVVKRRDIIKRRVAQGRARPVPQEVAKEASLESRVIWEYLGHDPPFNCRRTLDQYRHPSLHDTRARDDDQMLYKMTKERVYLNGRPAAASLAPVLGGNERVATHYDGGNAAGIGDDDEEQEDLYAESESDEDELFTKLEDDVLNGNVLMVDQLWLWVADTGNLVTFFPSREGIPIEGPLHQQADLRDSVFNEIKDDLTHPCENAFDLAALTVLHAVSALIERSSHEDLEIFRIFEEAISLLTENMTSSLKRFRTTGLWNRYGEEDDLKEDSSSIKARHKRENEMAEMETRINTSALSELQDIEDELSTLLHLFGEQEEQIERMIEIYDGSSNLSSPNRNPTPPLAESHPINSPLKDSSTGTSPFFVGPLTRNGRHFLQEAVFRLDSYRTQVSDMIMRAQSTRHELDKLLSTLQRQAQIDEGRLARQQADLSSSQSRSVMIFTVFTVIFLPLSFFTSLFGMNTHEWGGGDNIGLRTIGLIALPASALLIVLALFVAWSTFVRKTFKSLSKRIRRFRNRIRRWWTKRLTALWKRTDEKSRGRLDRLKMHRKREALEVKRQKAQITYDFWDWHYIDRETKYEIPSRNRKSFSLYQAKARMKREEEECTE